MSKTREPHVHGIVWLNEPGKIGTTWNPVVGCTAISTGCEHCYARREHNRRHAATGWVGRPKQYDKLFGQVQLMQDRLDVPLSWRLPRSVFVCSASDLFHKDVPAAYIDQVFAIMAFTPWHQYHVLTKRPERARDYFEDLNKRRHGCLHEYHGHFALVLDQVFGCAAVDKMWDKMTLFHHGGQPATSIGDATAWPWPLGNVRLGVSVENQQAADERIPILLDTPAACRFLSIEPLLGPVNLSPWIDRLDWIIVGGESGSNARPCDIEWIGSVVDQCKAAGVPVFVKQLGVDYGATWGRKAAKDVSRWPAVLQVREFPGKRGE